MLAVVSGAPCLADTELRIEWAQQVCPGLPATGDEAPQKLAPVVAAIIAAVAPKLVSGAVDLAAKSLQAAGEDRSDAMTAKTDVIFYSYLRARQNVVKARCLIIVEAENFNATTIPNDKHPWRANVLRVGAFQNPRMIFMAAVEAAPEGKLFRLVPAYLELSDWRKGSIFSSGSRDLIVAVTMSATGAEKGFASVAMTFKDIKRDTPYKVTDSLLANATTDYVPLPPLSAEGTKYIATVETAMVEKDKAASMLDANVQFGNRAANLAKGTIAPPTPPLPNSGHPYAKRLTEYCSAVRTANQDLDKTKREIPDVCNWQVSATLAKVDEARLAMYREPAWLQWAQETCWHNSADRVRKLAALDDKGAECTPPDNMLAAEHLHTAIATVAVVTEVIPGSKVAKYLGTALSESKVEVSSAIVGQLPPLTAAARGAEDAAQRALQQAVIQADFKVELAELALAELLTDSPASEATQKRMERQEAWYAANNAYRAAGLLPAYPQVAP